MKIDITSKKLIYIGFSFPHHKGKKSGYNQICNYLKYDTIIDSQNEYEFLTNKQLSLFLKLSRKLYTTFFGSLHLLSISKCILLATFRKNQVFHFIYAENSYKLLHYFTGRSNKIVCTFHQPISFFYENQLLIKQISKIDKIILMSKNDIGDFEKLTGRKNVYFIPHGINSQFYSPNPTVERSLEIIMIGTWLRDFTFADAIFQLLLSKFSNLKITIVAPISTKKNFKDNERIQLLNGISDDELKLLYSRAKLMFLPLTSYTANNAVLEATSAGCPVIVATNCADQSYFDTEQITILPLTQEIVLPYIENFLLSDFDYNKSKINSEYVKKNYDWDIIAKKTKQTLLSNN